MEPIVSAGLVYLAHRTMPLPFVDTPPRLLSLFCAEDIMSITTLLIILLVVFLLGGGGFFYSRRR